ncbi:hypothetical protein TVAG_171620 [Trichomonas vaginalis G3]|uniref:Uncharacterized protein n=1 Tax=Trichomonas vaginalis (strain ATCC PRA-98 / G3) TaxID=412133 RepID=A2EW87_TRIV3|nr:pre-mRNA 3'-splice site binding [Trichomonas vaginalis G3]EAY03064.1 hypothetical protein TVAG_171620 [Trichomonas vaginalis G3]KAI5484832.1 pre-mRNA 3'-splice site binding [Trichomonas vaginalis G3]|eukprot:XP_001315287.1 hypothetical protein [Trichomonas vaginalis G3]
MIDSKDDKEPGMCSIFEKTGCCPKGDRCNKVHFIPAMARTVIFHHIFPNPDFFIQCLPDGVITMSAQEKQRYIDAFFLDMFLMCRRFGAIEDLLLCSNTMDCLSGNFYVFYEQSDCARMALTALDGQYYAGRKVHVTLCSVPRYSTALCKSSMKGECSRGNECAFIHALEPSFALYQEVIPRINKLFPSAFRKPGDPPVVDNPNEIINGIYRNKNQMADLSKYIPPGFPNHDPAAFKGNNN